MKEWGYFAEHRRAKVNLSLSFDSEHGDPEVKGKKVIAVVCLIVQSSWLFIVSLPHFSIFLLSNKGVSSAIH